jgi:hypothetical protein
MSGFVKFEYSLRKISPGGVIHYYKTCTWQHYIASTASLLVALERWKVSHSLGGDDF